MSAVAAMTLALALGVGSDPYVRSRVDTGIANDPDAHCLWWGQSDVTFHQDTLGNPETTGASEFDAAVASMASWATVNDQCGSLIIRDGQRQADRTIGFNQDGANKNNILYRMSYCPDLAPSNDACWQDQTCNNKYDCWSGQKGTIALTTTTYDTQTGQIYDADIEFNGAWFVFTTVDAPPCVHPVYNQGCVATDVQNTLTHELGHALGLDHTTAPGSTMNPTAPAGETSKRSIDNGTRDFICEAYPKGGPARDCIISTVDPVLGEKHGCSAASGMPLLALAAGALTLLSRRRANR